MPRELGALADRHEFEEANGERVVARELEPAFDLILVEALEQHRVDVDGAEPGGRGGLDAAPDLVDEAVARNHGVAVGAERIDAHIDAAQSRRSERFSLLCEQQPVGGQRRYREGCFGRDSRYKLR